MRFIVSVFYLVSVGFCWYRVMENKVFGFVEFMLVGGGLVDLLLLCIYLCIKSGSS